MTSCNSHLQQLLLGLASTLGHLLRMYVYIIRLHVDLRSIIRIGNEKVMYMPGLQQQKRRP